MTDRSIHSLKKRALQRTKTLRHDSEGRPITPNIFRRTWSKLSIPFTRHYWEEAFEKTDEETLVDGRLLSYAYLEAGVIEFLAR